MKELNIGIVGATGVVGETFLQLLNERKTPVKSLKLFASERSLGQIKTFRDQEIKLEILNDNCFAGLDVVFFSSGDPISAEWAPKAVASGAFAVDNSAAFRMSEGTPLVVPEVNFHHIQEPSKAKIIANPNCSTIQLVMALNALKPFNLKDIRVASYQAVSGAGRDAIDDLKQHSEAGLNQEQAQPGSVFARNIGFDCHPAIGSIDDDGFCSEENKIVRETKKILDLKNTMVSAFTVRIPTFNGHAEAVWATVDQDVSREDVIASFTKTPGVQCLESNEDFFTLSQANGQDDTLVCKVRKAQDQSNTWMMWVLADNLRRGAASNGLLITEKLFS